MRKLAFVTGHCSTHSGYGFNGIGIKSLTHINGDGFLTIDGAKTIGIFKGSTHIGNVTQGNHAVSSKTNGKAANILCGFDQRWHLNTKASLGCIYFTGGDQQVVGAHRAQHFVSSDVVLLESVGVEDSLNHLISMTGNISF